MSTQIQMEKENIVTGGLMLGASWLLVKFIIYPVTELFIGITEVITNVNLNYWWGFYLQWGLVFLFFLISWNAYKEKTEKESKILEYLQNQKTKFENENKK